MMRGVRKALGVAITVVLLAVALAASAARADDLDLPVPKMTLYPGDVIGDDNLVERAFVARTVARSTVFEDRQGVVGKVAKRTLLPGQPILISAVRDPYLVTQGKVALVVFEANGLTITSMAMPLQNGGLGDMVSLRNPDSGTIIKGMVASDGTIRLAVP